MSGNTELPGKKLRAQAKATRVDAAAVTAAAAAKAREVAKKTPRLDPREPVERARGEGVPVERIPVERIPVEREPERQPERQPERDLPVGGDRPFERIPLERIPIGGVPLIIARPTLDRVAGESGGNPFWRGSWLGPCSGFPRPRASTTTCPSSTPR